VALPLLLALGACAGGDDSSEVASPGPLDTETTAAPGSTTEPPCSQERHVVVFDYAGTLTLEDAVTVVQQEFQVPPRPGSADVVNAYRDRGYEIMYVVTAPATMPVGETTLDDTLTVWLTSNGFPLDEGARLWTWEEGGDPMVAIVEELLRLGQADVTIDAAYTDDLDKANALASGGVATSGLWTLGEAAGMAGATAVPDDDLTAHVATVERLGMVCQPGQ
jgi:hypothetical protein